MRALIYAIMSAILAIVIAAFEFYPQYQGYYDDLKRGDPKEIPLEDFLHPSSSPANPNPDKNRIAPFNKYNKPVFIFALDISRSSEKTLRSEDLLGSLSWIKEYLEEIDCVLDSQFINFNDINGKDTIDLPLITSKIKISRILLELKNIDAEFSVWTIGEYAAKIFPDNKKALATDDNLASSIEKIFDLSSEDLSYYTDFLHFFKRITNRYCKNNKKNPIVIIIISDFVHDKYNLPKNSTGSKQQQEDFKTERSEIEKKLFDLGKDEVYLKCIFIGKSEDSNEEQTEEIKSLKFPLLSSINKKHIFHPNHFELYPFKEKNERITYLTIRGTKPITFYYSYNERKSVSVKLRISIPGQYEFGLESDNRESNNFKMLKCRIIGYNDKGEPGTKRKSECKLNENGPPQTLTVEKYESIELTYEGELNHMESFPKLKLIIPNRLVKFILPIKFEKKPPSPLDKPGIVLAFLKTTAIIFFILLLLSWFLLPHIIAFCRSSTFIIILFFKRKDSRP